MSKKKAFAFLLVVLSLVLFVFGGCNANSRIILLDETSTSLSSYQYAINTFPSDLTVDPISDYKDAAKKGKQLWQQEWGELADDYLNRDTEVLYVSGKDAWMVTGTLPKDFVGMVPISIIKSDGTVLSAGWV